jgi:hypothetical protein
MASLFAAREKLKSEDPLKRSRENSAILKSLDVGEMAAPSSGSSALVDERPGF